MGRAILPTNFYMSLIKNSIVLSAASLFQKLMGILRSVFVAHFFGTSSFLDCFLVALIPINFLKMLIGTSMADLLIPEYVKNKEQQKELFTSLFLGGLLISSVMFVIVFFTSPVIAQYIGAGFSDEKRELTEKLIKVLSVLIVFQVSNNILRSLTIARGIFLVYVVSNMLGSGILLVVIIFYPKYGQGVLSASVLIAEIAVMLYLIACSRHQFQITLHGIKKNLHILKDKTLSLVALSGIVGLERINPTIDNYFAGYLGKGSVATLSYGETIYASIVEITAGTTVSVLYPRLSEIRENDEFQKFLSRIIKNVVFVFIPVMALTIYYSNDIVRMFYQRGHFTPEDTTSTAKILSCYSLGMVFYQMRVLLARRLYVIDDRQFVIYVTLLSIAANYILDRMLIKFFGLQGIAFATSFVEMITCTVMFIRIRKGSFSLKEFLYMLKITILTVLLLFSIDYLIIKLLTPFYSNWIVAVIFFLVLWFFITMKMSLVPEDINSFFRKYMIKDKNV